MCDVSTELCTPGQVRDGFVCGCALERKWAGCPSICTILPPITTTRPQHTHTTGEHRVLNTDAGAAPGGPGDGGRAGRRAQLPRRAHRHQHAYVPRVCVCVLHESWLAVIHQMSMPFRHLPAPLICNSTPFTVLYTHIRPQSPSSPSRGPITAGTWAWRRRAWSQRSGLGS